MTSVVFQFPLYWYSTPAILKGGETLFLIYGFAYGTDGSRLEGKKFLCSIYCGGKEGMPTKLTAAIIPIRDYSPLEQTAALWYGILAPYALFSSRTALESRITGHVERYKFLLDP